MGVAKLLKIAIVRTLSRFVIVILTSSIIFLTFHLLDMEHIVLFESNF